MNEKKMFYIGLKKMYYCDVLEQFNIETFNIDIIESISFLVFILFLGGLYFYDVWLCFGLFLTFSIYFLCNTFTFNFILLIF